MDEKSSVTDVSEIKDSKDPGKISGLREERSSDSECPATSSTDKTSAASTPLTSHSSDFDLGKAGASSGSVLPPELPGHSGATSLGKVLLLSSKAREIASKSLQAVTRSLSSPKKDGGSPTTTTDTSPTAWSKFKKAFSSEKSPKVVEIADGAKAVTDDKKMVLDAKEESTSPKKSFVKEYLDKLSSPKKCSPTIPVPPPSEFVDVDLTEGAPVCEAVLATKEKKSRFAGLLKLTRDKLSPNKSPVSRPQLAADTESVGSSRSVEEMDTSISNKPVETDSEEQALEKASLLDEIKKGKFGSKIDKLRGEQEVFEGMQVDKTKSASGDYKAADENLLK